MAKEEVTVGWPDAAQAADGWSSAGSCAGWRVLRAAECPASPQLACQATADCCSSSCSSVRPLKTEAGCSATGPSALAYSSRFLTSSHQQPLVARVHRRTLRNRPRFQYAVGFEAEVKVQPAGGVLLDDEHRLMGAVLAITPRLGRATKIPLATVLSEGHHRQPGRRRLIK